MTKKKAAPKKRKKGRPSLYTEALAVKICLRLAEGESLRKICEAKGMPSAETVRRWLLDDEDFCAQYVRAREVQADRFAEEILEIADDASDDWTVGKEDKKVVDHEHVQRSRLRVDTRKWLMARMAPKKYGDKMQHVGEGGGPIRTEVDLTGIPTDVLRELRKLAARI